jgi:hypothetical protein
MKRSLDKHNKSFYYMDIQNQIAHYNHLIKIKGDLTINSVRSIPLSSRLKNKYASTL